MESNKKSRALGRVPLPRGLSSLISSQPVPVAPAVEGNAAAQIETLPETPQPGDGAVRYVPIRQVTNNPHQPRQVFSEAELDELSSSIKTLGVLQPILVREIAGTDIQAGYKYQVIAGERRWRAAQRASLEQVPVIIKEIDDQAALEIGLVENVQRENLNPIELAQAYQRLSDQFGLTQQQVAEKVGKDRASISNVVRLLKLPADVQELVRSGALSLGHAKCILAVKDSSAQSRLAKKALEEQLSVRDLEALVAKVVVLDSGKRPAPDATNTRPDGEGVQEVYPEVVAKLRAALGTKVVLTRAKNGSGSVVVSFYNEQDLDRIVDQICGPKV